MIKSTSWDAWACRFVGATFEPDVYFDAGRVSRWWRTGMDCIDNDTLLASIAQFLIDGGEDDAANVLLACNLDVWESGDTWYNGDECTSAVHVSLTGPRAAFEILSNHDHPVTEAVSRAISALLPPNYYLRHLTPHAGFVKIDTQWRSELLEIARGKGVHNQAAEAKWAKIWSNLRFRSESEVRIAQALDRACVLFLPNCKARVGSSGDRKNREADFLVCCGGKWGILEVDGEPFHPPTRTVDDHERDRVFKHHGVIVVEHFDANECFGNPDGVVKRFLDLLERA